MAEYSYRWLSQGLYVPERPLRAVRARRDTPRPPRYRIPVHRARNAGIRDFAGITRCHSTYWNRHRYRCTPRLAVSRTLTPTVRIVSPRRSPSAKCKLKYLLSAYNKLIMKNMYI